ncbi:MAG: hypothetical protein BWY82_02548 [Verrucomicrobia bacterium ADurb.Bin474]|nr:MAG: hypothetical protein BWY82_02548 [Verrucomicrobia bacterium ADurb.Bin474]
MVTARNKYHFKVRYVFRHPCQCPQNGFVVINGLESPCADEAYWAPPEISLVEHRWSNANEQRLDQCSGRLVACLGSQVLAICEHL